MTILPSAVSCRVPELRRPAGREQANGSRLSGQERLGLSSHRLTNFVRSYKDRHDLLVTLQTTLQSFASAKTHNPADRYNQCRVKRLSKAPGLGRSQISRP